jgi:hypothetical protein
MGKDEDEREKRAENRWWRLKILHEHKKWNANIAAIDMSVTECEAAINNKSDWSGEEFTVEPETDGIRASAKGSTVRDGYMLAKVKEQVQKGDGVVVVNVGIGHMAHLSEGVGHRHVSCKTKYVEPEIQADLHWQRGLVGKFPTTEVNEFFGKTLCDILEKFNGKVKVVQPGQSSYSHHHVCAESPRQKVQTDTSPNLANVL